MAFTGKDSNAKCRQVCQHEIALAIIEHEANSTRPKEAVLLTEASPQDETTTHDKQNDGTHFRLGDIPNATEALRSVLPTK